MHRRDPLAPRQRERHGRGVAADLGGHACLLGGLAVAPRASEVEVHRAREKGRAPDPVGGAGCAHPLPAPTPPLLCPCPPSTPAAGNRARTLARTRGNGPNPNSSLEWHHDECTGRQ